MNSYLIIVDRVFPLASSNGSCSIKIAEELVRRNNRVVILSLFDENLTKPIFINGVEYCSIGYDEKKYTVYLSEKIFGMFSDRDAVKLLEEMSSNIIETRGINVLMPFYKPIDTVCCALKLAKRYSLRLMSMLYDLPLVQDRNPLKEYIVSHRFIQIVAKLINYGNVYTLKYNYGYYKNKRKTLRGIITVSIPNISRINSKETSKKELAHQRCKLVYSGSFWNTIRNPEKMLNALLIIMQYDIELHLYSWGCEDIINKYKTLFGDRLIIHGRCDSKTIHEALQDADVLLNLSNDTEYQVPGKIFEYFSTGKPILNFVYRADDPAMEEYNKYPKILTVPLHNLPNGKIIIDFILNEKGSEIDFESVEKIYYESTAKGYVDILCSNDCI